MQAHELVQSVANISGHDDPIEHLRMALLIGLRQSDLASLESQDELLAQYREVTALIQSNTDQHAAVSDELDTLALSQPCEFSPSHIWTLVRAIKIQSRVLQMYLGTSSAQV